MSLRQRYYLAILPLFLGLGLINGVLAYYIEREELLWGLRERAQGVAISVAGFWDVISSGRVKTPTAVLEGYSQRLGGLSIVRFEADGGSWRKLEVFLASDSPEPPAPAADFEVRQQAGELTWMFVENPSSGFDLNVGYAPIDGPPGNLSVIAIAERDVTLRDAMSMLMQRLLALMLVLLLAGVAIAEMIARAAARELNVLTRAARDAAQDRFLTQLPAGRIRELNDLGGTLLTMTSLLAEENQQSRRRFFQAELLPGDVEHAAGFHSVLERELPTSMGPAQCTYRRLGAIAPEDFCGWRSTADGWYLMVGRTLTHDGAASVLARMVHADAAREFLLGVATQVTDRPWPEALRVFPCAFLQVIFVPVDSAAPIAWTLEAGSGELLAWKLKSARVVLGTMTGAALQIGQTYADQFLERSLGQTADELSSLLGARCRGLLVICDLQPRAPGELHSAIANFRAATH